MAEAFKPRFVDLVRNYTRTQGTGNIVLGAAVGGYNGFSPAIVAGDQFYYSMTSLANPAEREVGRGKMLPNGAISRTPSNGVLTSFTSGTKIVALTAAAEWHADAQQAIALGVHQPLFTDIAAMRFAPGVQRVQTCGRTVRGENAAFYVRDPDQTALTVGGQRAIQVHGRTAQEVTSWLSPIRTQDASGAYWVIDDTAQEVHLGHFGGKPDAAYNSLVANSVTGTENLPALQAFINWRQYVHEGNAGARRPVAIPAGKYRMTGFIDVRLPGVRMIGRGATFVGNPRLVVAAAAEDFECEGLTLISNTGDRVDYLFNLSGSKMRLSDTSWHKAPAANGYIGYVREAAAYLTIRGFACSGSNGVYLSGHDHNISGFDMTAPAEFAEPDDCWVVKGVNNSSYNISISRGTSRNYQAVVSIGSEVGKFASDASPYSVSVKNVRVSNVTAENCTSILYVKPGSNEGNDYRWGLVDGVHLDNAMLTDQTGKRFRAGVYIRVGRGSWTRNIRVNNVTIVARAPSTDLEISAGFKAEIAANEGVPIGTGSIVEDVFINNLTVNDAHNGDPEGVNGAVGRPIYHGWRIQKDTGADGIIRRVEFNNMRVNGCRDSGGYLRAGIEGPIVVNRFVGSNLSNTPPQTSVRGGLQALSPMVVRDCEISMSANNNGATNRGIYCDSNVDKTVPIHGEVAQIPIGALAAGATDYRMFVAPRESWISKVELLNRNSITASALNKITVALSNRHTGATFLTVDTETGIAVAADTPVSLNGATMFTGSNAYLPKGKALRFTLTSAGSATLSGAMLVIHYVPFGAA